MPTQPHKRGPGRPPIPKAERRVTLAVRVAPETRAMLRAAAALGEPQGRLIDRGVAALFAAREAEAARVAALVPGGAK